MGKLWHRRWNKTASPQHTRQNSKFDCRAWKSLHRTHLVNTVKSRTPILTYGIQRCSVALATVLADSCTIIIIRNLIAATLITVDVRNADVTATTIDADDVNTATKPTDAGIFPANATLTEADGGDDAYAVNLVSSAAVNDAGKAVRSKEWQVGWYFWFYGKQTRLKTNSIQPLWSTQTISF